MNQSDTILRNLGGSMSMLPNYAEQRDRSRSPRGDSEPRASFNFPGFYVRDNSDASTSARDDTLGLFNS